jgi:hypothetical protein
MSTRNTCSYFCPSTPCSWPVWSGDTSGRKACCPSGYKCLPSGSLISDNSQVATICVDQTSPFTCNVEGCLTLLRLYGNRDRRFQLHSFDLKFKNIVYAPDPTNVWHNTSLFVFYLASLITIIGVGSALLPVMWRLGFKTASFVAWLCRCWRISNTSLRYLSLPYSDTIVFESFFFI